METVYIYKMASVLTRSKHIYILAAAGLDRLVRADC